MHTPVYFIQAVAEGEAQGVVEVLSASGSVSPWFMSHVYDLLTAGAAGQGAGPKGGRTRGRVGGSSVLGRPLPLSGGDQVGSVGTGPEELSTLSCLYMRVASLPLASYSYLLNDSTPIHRRSIGASCSLRP